MSASAPSTDKPRLRGWLHTGVCPIVAVGGLALVCLAPAGRATASCAVYAAAGLMLFATSAIYHRGTWSHHAESVIARLDHSSIYVLIAGTYTPLAVLGLRGAAQVILVLVIWAGAIAGVLLCCLRPRASRTALTALYIILGWAILPLLPDLLHRCGPAVVSLTFVGGGLYTAGGIVYALRRPDPSPSWFGFHELFHALTIAGWAVQYLAISLLVYRLRG